MQAMGDTGVLKDFPHPLTGTQCVGGKVEHHRIAGAQQLLHVLAHDIAQIGRAADVLGHGVDGARIKLAQPCIFADQQRPGLVRQPAGQGRFAGGDFAADHVQRRSAGIS